MFVVRSLYHNPAGIMGHSIHNVDISKPCLPTPYTLSEICPVQLINLWRAHFSSLPVVIEGKHLPTEVSEDTQLKSDQDPGEDNEQAGELSRDGLWQFVQKLFGCANDPAGVRPIRRTAKFSKTTLFMVKKWTLHSLATALVDILAVSMPIAPYFKTLLCDKTAHFRVAFLLSPAQGAPV